MIQNADAEIPQTHEGSRSQNGFFESSYKAILWMFLLAAPFYLWIAGKVLTPGDMSAYLLDVSHWLPKDNQLIRDMEKFSEVAGMERGNVIRISWPGCTEEDGRLYELKKKLADALWPSSNFAKSGSPFFDNVVTIKDFIDQLKSDGVKFTDAQIYRQMESVLLGEDGTTCLLVIFPSREPEDRQLAIREIRRISDTVNGLAAGDVRLFGGPVYTARIDELGTEIATKFTPISVLLSALAAWLCLRKLVVMAAVLLNSIVATCFALASMHATNAVMDPLLMLIPGFWFIMSTSAGLHIVNYFYEERERLGSAAGLGTATFKVAFRPAFLATLTTCIGLASLCTSDIMPLWRFGFHSAIGLACGFVAMFLFLPAFLNLVSNRIESSNAIRQPANRDYRFWDWYENFATGFNYKTTAAFLFLMVIAAIGLGELQFSNKLKNQFAEDTRINEDTTWFEENIGPVIPFELLVRFPKDNLPRPSQCLRYIDALQEKIDGMSLANKTLSATAIVPFESGTGARQSIVRTILDKRIAKQRESLSKTGYVIEEENDELWRMTVFVYNGAEATLSDYFHEIQRVIADHEAQFDAEELGATVSFAGLGSRMAVITSKLGGGLVESCVVSAILISLIVIIALRSVFLGLTAMIPNVFPIVLSFGFFGYYQPSLDIGSIMTASIAMGIAVDDTIHFMYWFRRGTNEKLLRVDAIKLAIRKCGRAIFATSLICGLGFFVYFFCDFMPVARFGQLLFFMLIAALVGDLFFLPALLQSLPEKLLGFDAAEVQPE